MSQFAGDIGEPLRHIELEPIPSDVPIAEPSPTYEPELVPA